MSTIYVLSDGTQKNYKPLLFGEREKLKGIAEGIAVNLKWTKKLNKEDFIDAWLNDESVIEYRKLLKEIWNFTAPTIIKEYGVCDICESLEFKTYSKQFVIPSQNYEGSITHHDLCQSCYEKEFEKDKEYSRWTEQ